MKNLIYLFLIFIFQYSFPQKNNENLIQDINAEPYLEQISKLFDPSRTIQIEFRYEIITPEPPSQVSDMGSIIIRGENYKLRTNDGEIFYNGKYLWVYNVEAKEVYKSIPSGENMNDMLLAPFRLIKDFRKYYKYQLKDDINQSGDVYAQIELYPMDLNTVFSIMRILVNKKTGSLYSFSMQQKDGVVYKILTKDIIKNVKISNDIFTWDPNLNPDVLEVEM